MKTRSQGRTHRRLAEAIRLRREELGLTQEQAAERCGLSTRYWRELEAARPAVRLEVIDRILGGFGWTWHDLACHLDDPPSGRRSPAGVYRLLDEVWLHSTARDRELVSYTLRVLAKHRTTKG